MTLKSAIRALGLFALLLTACEKSDNDAIFTQLCVRLVMPDNRPIERLEILTSQSYFHNINTFERTAFPVAEQGTAVLQLRKGVYTFIVEAQATYATGETKLLRCADYNQITQAATWVEDRESIVLLLKSVN